MVKPLLLALLFLPAAVALLPGCSEQSSGGKTGQSPSVPVAKNPDATVSPPSANVPAVESDSGAKLILRPADGVELIMIRIPAGEFTMGSPQTEAFRGDGEGPQRLVRIERPYYLGQCEVSQAQWMSVMDANPSEYVGPTLPVERVNWNECREFCKRLTARTGRRIRLPSEAEWEYACRAGKQTAFGFGTTISTDQANYSGKAMPYADGVHGVYRDKTTPVCGLAANSWGLFDMHGNVFEWCEDYWHENYQGAPADQSPWLDAPSPLMHRILRGGSWSDHPMYLRSAFRNHHEPSDGGPRSRYGLRVAADVE